MSDKRKKRKNRYGFTLHDGTRVTTVTAPLDPRNIHNCSKSILRKRLVDHGIRDPELLWAEPKFVGMRVRSLQSQSSNQSPQS